MIMIIIPGWARDTSYQILKTIQPSCTMNHNSNIQEQTQFPAANGLFDLAATSSQHLFPIGVHYAHVIIELQ